MNWVRVKSKMLAAVAYNPDWHYLYLEFRSGDIYCYRCVPRPFGKSALSLRKQRFGAARQQGGASGSFESFFIGTYAAKRIGILQMSFIGPDRPEKNTTNLILAG